MNKPRYEAQYIDNVEEPNWRITDKTTDSRIATCYLKENADLIVSALNAAPQPSTATDSTAPCRDGVGQGEVASAAPDSGEGMPEDAAIHGWENVTESSGPTYWSFDLAERSSPLVLKSDYDRLRAYALSLHEIVRKP